MAKQHPITKATNAVERATKKLDDTMDKFRTAGRKALEDGDQAKYDKLAEENRDKEYELRKDLEDATENLRLANAGVDVAEQEEAEEEEGPPPEPSTAPGPGEDEEE